MTAEVINAKQGLTRIPTYAQLIKEIDREKFKTNDIRKIFDRNAWRQKERERYEQYKRQKLEKQKEKVECPICKIEISRTKC